MSIYIMSTASKRNIQQLHFVHVIVHNAFSLAHVQLWTQICNTNIYNIIHSLRLDAIKHAGVDVEGTHDGGDDAVLAEVGQLVTQGIVKANDSALAGAVVCQSSHTKQTSSTRNGHNMAMVSPKHGRQKRLHRLPSDQNAVDINKVYDINFILQLFRIFFFHLHVTLYQSHNFKDN